MPSGPRATAESLPLSDVEVDDAFWTPRLETNRSVTVAHQYDQLEATGCLSNFRRVAAGERGGFEGPMFVDSDAYKWLEAASDELSGESDPDLRARVDGVVDLVADAQAGDGYLHTYFQLEEPEGRWSNLSRMHELYCAGHLIEAAVAHHRATGEARLLGVATRFADHVVDVLGGDADGVPGHPEVELALVKLFRVTDDRRYLDLAREFVDRRGTERSGLAAEVANADAVGGADFVHHGERTADTARERFLVDGEYDGRYVQDHAPVREQETAEGHAVRATYLYTAVASLLQEEADEALRAAVDRLWRNVTRRRSYVTGGIGSERAHEGFTEDFDLPNRTAYAETCAAVGSVRWNRRLFELTGDAVHADVVERTLYNGFLAGVSRTGDEFFYENPLASTGDHRRTEWFYVACCPPNAARLLASLGRHLYARSRAGDALYVNQFVGSRVDTTLDGRRVAFTQSTDYPWEGDVAIEFTHEAPVRFELRVRVPAWADAVDATVNGEPVATDPAADYLRVERAWRAGDRVEVSVPLPVEALVAHPRVRQDAGRVALRRGPLVYCVEDADHDVPVEAVSVTDPGAFAAEHEPALLGGVTVLRGEGVADATESWTDALYRPVEAVDRRPVEVVAVPYYSWANREPGAMRVWLPTTSRTRRVSGR